MVPATLETVELTLLMELLLQPFGTPSVTRTTATEPFVRAAWQTSAAIQGALDCGVSGIMIPMVSSASDARAAVRDSPNESRQEPVTPSGFTA